jgi:hypothetical protein
MFELVAAGIARRSINTQWILEPENYLRDSQLSDVENWVTSKDFVVSI